MKKLFTMSVLALAVSFGAVSCKKKNYDADLQAKATEITATYPNASVQVTDGVAHLSGTFASEAEKSQAMASLKAVPNMKEVMDMATVVPPAAPVQVNAVDAATLAKVQDAIKDFPSVKAEEVNGELTLTGNASSVQARKIKESVDALQIGKYNNNIVVK